MKKIVSILLCLIIVLTLVSCGENIDDMTVTTTGSTRTDISTSENIAKEDDNDSDTEETVLTADEIEWFNTEYFNGETINIRNNFLACEYDKPEEIELSQLFYNGVPDGDDITEAELDELKKEKSFVTELDTIKITEEQMDLVFEEHTGLTIDEIDRKGLESFFYLGKYNSYYLNHSDANYQLILITEGYEDVNGNIVLRYETLNSSIKVFGQVTLKDIGNNKYHFVSNNIQ